MYISKERTSVFSLDNLQNRTTKQHSCDDRPLFFLRLLYRTCITTVFISLIFIDTVHCDVFFAYKQRDLSTVLIRESTYDSLVSTPWF